MNSRLDQIKDIVGSDVDVGFRTAPWVAIGGELLRSFNDITREISVTRNATLYDFDRDMWSSADFDYRKEYILFRDLIHPKPSYTARAAYKMLGIMFTKFLMAKKRRPAVTHAVGISKGATSSHTQYHAEDRIAKIASTIAATSTTTATTATTSANILRTSYPQEALLQLSTGKMLYFHYRIYRTIAALTLRS
jgi:hypothetical protein